MTDKWQRSFSWSKISGYNRCARQFKFKYIDEIEEDSSEAMHDGTSMHEYMEQYYDAHENPEDGPSQEVAVDLGKEMFEPQEQAKYREWIKQFHAWNKHLFDVWGAEHWTPVDTELWVEVETPEGFDRMEPGLTHHGYIDRLQWNPNRGSYGVIDYKSKAKDGSNIKGQTAYYSEVLLEIADILDEPVEWAGCYGYKTGKFKMWDLHWKSVRATKRKVNALRELDSGWEPDYGYHCEFCPYMEECSELDAQQEGLLEL